ncbi:hypothetical protein MW887_004365 [Aspergillus wentii]|nr:hypothetical protein MW887_004365 [Aspergillus wentii]
MAFTNIQLPTLSGENVFTRPLSPADVKSCVNVESAFVERERCSEEKFVYRLNQTPNLCLGLFTSTNNEAQLIGHIIANRSSAPTITDGSMQMPDNWQSLSEDSTVVVDN